ncbi:MAG TPA: carbohydrate binding domain-containing protein, partial [Phototrophicaceae bacterium]|nr:carbohydrate binding domain-containing protein [Phototrophicaceae bacterium]
MKAKKSPVLLLIILASVAIFLMLHLTVVADPTGITDTTSTTATNDGTINVGEYIGCSDGIGTGFGDVIGASGDLCVDSSDTGALNFGLVKGPGDLNDAVVIYIDSVAGGFGSTANFTDDADGLRKAISGKDGSNVSVMTFAGGFGADYAIAFSQDFGGLWQLVENGSHTFIKSVNLTPTATTTSAGYELDLTLADIGLVQGEGFAYVATYLSQTAYRSNEFHGVAGPLDGPESGGNFGWTPVTLGATDYNKFFSYVIPVDTPTSTETPTLGVTETPTPTPTQAVTELLVNGGFETELEPWVAKNATKDKVKCDTPEKIIAYEGECAYRFKGGAAENSKIQQLIDLTGLTFAVDDAVSLSLFVNGGNAATSGKVKVVIGYSDTTQAGKITATIVSTADYTELTGTYALQSAAVNKIKVQIKNKSTSGKLYVDAVSLGYTTAGGGG